MNSFLKFYAQVKNNKRLNWHRARGPFYKMDVSAATVAFFSKRWIAEEGYSCSRNVHFIKIFLASVNIFTPFFTIFNMSGYKPYIYF